MRMCTICRQQYPKRELIRLVRTPEGDILLDETGKKPGRGFYVCRKESCLAQAGKGQRLDKVCGVQVGEEVRNELKERAKDGVGT